MDEKHQDSNDLTEVRYNPVVVHDGSCEHFWLDQGDDPEGKGQASCRDCVMGRYFNRKEWRVENGRIITR